MNEKSETEYIDKLALIHLQGGKVLETLSRGKDTWYIPGGKREEGETDQQALIREIREELSITLAPEALTFYGVFEAQAHGKAEGMVVRMTCYQVDELPAEPVASSEVEKFDYFSYAQKDLTSPVDHLIFDDLHAKGLLQ